MNIKDMPHVTVEQVLALRAAAIELEEELAITKQARTAYRISLENLEAENEKLKKELEAVSYCAKWNEQELVELKASLPKIKADAVRLAISECKYNGADGQGWESDLEQYANKLEAGE